MSADELRQAAATLRERAEKAADGPWTFQTYGNGHPPLVIGSDRGGDIAVAETLDKPHLSDARYIATVHPGVGLALADWLDAEAGIYERLEAISMEVTPKGGPGRANFRSATPLGFARAVFAANGSRRAAA